MFSSFKLKHFTKLVQHIQKNENWSRRYYCLTDFFPDYPLPLKKSILIVLHNS